MKNGFKVWIIGWIIIFSSMYGYANEAKGYKVVLGSFSTFDEAKAKLAKLEHELSEDDYLLQKKHHYKIVARASGKAFIVGVEPLETKAVADEVIRRFKHICPDAYSNGYFGPTQGAVFLEHISSAPAVEEANRSIPEKVEKSVNSKPIDVVNLPREEKEKFPLLWVIAAGSIVLMIVAFIGVKRRTPAKEGSSIQHEKETSEAKSNEEIGSEVADVPAVIKASPVWIESAEKDIFYRLKKNVFFMTLLKELKEASESKDASRCRDLIDEVLRYQKNFRKSEVITTIERLVETKEFDQLAFFLNREIK